MQVEKRKSFGIQMHGRECFEICNKELCRKRSEEVHGGEVIRAKRRANNEGHVKDDPGEE